MSEAGNGVRSRIDGTMSKSSWAVRWAKRPEAPVISIINASFR